MPRGQEGDKVFFERVMFHVEQREVSTGTRLGRVCHLPPPRGLIEPQGVGVLFINLEGGVLPCWRMREAKGPGRCLRQSLVAVLRVR